MILYLEERVAVRPDRCVLSGALTASKHRDPRSHLANSGQGEKPTKHEAPTTERAKISATVSIMASSALYLFCGEMFRCELCNIKFTMKIHLQKHCRTHHPENDESNPHLPGIRRNSLPTCTDCDVFFEDEKKLRAHQQTHTGSNQYACEECNAMFVTEDGLQSHANLHKLSRFSCPRCNLDFSHSLVLRLHCSRRHKDPEHDKGNNRITMSSGEPGALFESTKSESSFSHGCDVEFSLRNTPGSQLPAHVSTPA